MQATSELLGWFSPAWSAGASAHVVGMWPLLQPDILAGQSPPEVEGELRSIIRAIMEQAGLPEPTLHTNVPFPFPTNASDGEVSLSQVPNAPLQMTELILGAEFMRVSYHDARPTLARLETLGGAEVEGAWWLDAACCRATKATEAAWKKVRQRWADETLANHEARYTTIAPEVSDAIQTIPHQWVTLTFAPAFASGMMRTVLKQAVARVKARRDAERAAAVAEEKALRVTAEERAKLLEERAGQYPGMPRVLTRTMTGVARPDGDRRFIVESDAGRITVANGPRIILPKEQLKPFHGVIAAQLARMAHRAWQSGEANSSELVFQVGRDALRDQFGDVTGGAHGLLKFVLDLTEFEVEGFRLIDAANLFEGKRVGSGRPATMMRVVVGAPLSPGSLFAKLRDNKVEWPDGERWFSPVLPQYFGGVLEPKHRMRERHAVEVVLGSLLMDRREAYATEGIRPVELADELGHLTGFKTADAERLLEHATNTHTGQGKLVSIFQPVGDGSDRYQLGAAYVDAHTMILGAAGRSEQKRSAAAKSRMPTPKRRKRPNS